MANCPACQAALTDADFAAGRCLACGLTLDVQGAEKEPQHSGSETDATLISDVYADEGDEAEAAGGQTTSLLCTNCRQALTAADIQAGRCPHCGQTVGGKPEDSADQQRTHEEPPGDASQQPDTPQQTEQATFFTCRGCQASLTQADVHVAGRCPSCGLDFAHNPPLPGPDREAGSGDTDMTVISDVFSEEGEEAVETGAKTEPHAAEPPPPAEAPEGSTPDTSIESGTGISPDALESLDSAWRDFKSSDLPTMSVRARDLHSGSAKSTLVIKSKSFGTVGKPATEADAEYELVNVLGEGGMGVVFDARQTCIDRSVAIKLLKPQFNRDAKNRDKFLAEAVVTGELDHPNIVPIYELGANDTGTLFYSMKQVRGTPWKRVLKEKSLEENLDILLRVADAIAFAHSRGVTHRDIKPDNVMLGDFGEVLVMDWGLAQPTKAFRKAQSIADIKSMGGTPAYMAPEMASGPVDKIGPHSDIYLLGAVLFEIVAGIPPHTGRTATDCLLAAARNAIQPTDKDGELLQIALKAMATDPAGRYRSVPAFQAAVRDYLAHSESILLADRAVEDLATAEQSGNYEDYQASVYGLQKALELWEGNEPAQEHLLEAGIAYARCAKNKGDLELAESLLDPGNPHHAPLLGEIHEAQKEREAHTRRLRNARRLMTGLAALLFISITTGFFVVKGQRDRAQRAERRARVAADQERQAKLAAQKAEEAEREARRDAEALADRNRQLANRNEELFQQEREAKIAEQDAKIEAQNAAERERLAKQAEEYEAYIARIGLAAAKIEENAFDAAEDVLLAASPEYRDWEWGRLMHLCTMDEETLPTETPVESIALSPDGNRLAVGGWNGTAVVWDLAANRTLHTLRHGGRYVHAVAFSPDGRLIATGSDDDSGYIKLWDAESGERLPQTFKSTPASPSSRGAADNRFAGEHTGAVVSLQFSHDGERLLSGSFDHTARLWDVATGRQMRRFYGHTWWVWSVAFCPEFDGEGNRVDEIRLLTAGQDGSVIVWTDKTARDLPPESREDIWAEGHEVAQGNPFYGHDGAVYAATFTPDGKQVVSGGFDRRILIWDPELVPEDDLKKRVLGAPLEKTPVRELVGHSGSVRSLDTSTDGRLLVSGGADNTVRVWDLRSGTSIRTFRGHDSWVRGCRFTPDGTSIYSGGYDSKVMRWSLDGKQELVVLQGRDFEGHGDAVLAADFSQNGQTVVTASRDRTARLWNTSTGDELATLREGHEFLTTSVRFSPDGRRLITSAVDNTTRIWDLTTGTELAFSPLRGTGRSATVALSHDGKWILTGNEGRSGSLQGAINLWNAETGEHLRRLKGHQHEVTAAAFSPADRHLAVTGDASGRCLLWDLEEGSVRHRLYDDLSGHTGKVVAAAFLPNGERALTASDDNTVAQWDLRTGEEDKSRMLKHPDSVTAMTLEADGRHVLTACADGVVREWNIDTAEVVRTWELTGSRQTLAGNLQRQMDRRNWGPAELAVHSGVGEDRILQVLAAERAPDDPVVEQLAASLGLTVPSLLRPVASALAVSPAGLALAVDPADGKVHVWNLDTGQVHAPVQNGQAWSAVFSPDEQNARIAVVGGSEARIWDVAAGKELITLTPHGTVASASVSPSGNWVVTAGWDGSARLWDAATGAALLKLEGGHEGAVYRAAFSPIAGQNRIVTCGEDGRAVLWQVVTDGGEGGPQAIERVEAIRTYGGRRAAVRHVAFSHDGEYVVTSSDDGAATIWDTRTDEELRQAGLQNKPLCVLSGHDGAVLCAEFSADGNRVITGAGTGDHKARIWKLDRADPRQWKASVEFILDGHTAAVTSVALSPAKDRNGNGRWDPGEPNAVRALTASRDSFVKVWDTGGPGLPALEEDMPEEGAAASNPEANASASPRRAKEILTLRGHNRAVTSVRFSPDGRSVLTAGEDGRVILWPAAEWGGEAER